MLQFLNYRDTRLSDDFIEELVKFTSAKHWFVRQMRDRGAGLNTEEETNVAVASREMPLQWVVVENKIKFDLRHNHGQSSGLFLDQRDNRKKLMNMGDGKSVANFFSYTCGLDRKSTR